MRNRHWSVLATCVLMLALFPLSILAHGEEKKTPQMSAEEKAMMEAWTKAMTPGDPHKKLDVIVGTWNTKVSSWMAPGAPPMESTGVSENRWVLGGRFIEQRYDGTFMGQKFEGLGYTGYDNVKKMYVGTWVDSMSTGIMSSVGKGSDDGKSMSFSATMDDPMTGKTVTMEEKLMIIDNDHHTFEMWSPAPDGKMFKMMEIHYMRKK